jgi:hypothetical protein
VNIFIRAMSVVAIGSMLATLAPPAHARDRVLRQQRLGGPRTAPAQIRRPAPVAERAPRPAPGSGPVKNPAARPAPVRPAPRVIAPEPRGYLVSPPYYGPSSVYASPGAGVGVGVGSRGGVSVGGAVGGGVGTSGGGSVMDSVINGAALGGVGGPIGMAVGAGVGLLHGLWAKNRRDKQAQAEAARQKEIDRELEREMGNAPHGGDQGVRIVKDHLADEPAGGTPQAAPDTMVASIPASPQPARPAATAAPRPDALDAEGFRPVHEGGRLVRRERAGPDGKPEVVLHYDDAGQLVRRQESTRGDGRLDTTLFYGRGGLERKESDTDGDGAIDVVAAYDGLGNLAHMETVEAGTRTRRHFDASGAVTREDALDAGGDVVASDFYERGRLVRRELYEIDESAFTRVPLVSAQTTGAR